MKGGADLTVENQSSIRFSVEESIWFQRGQEVSELLSMSLDPEIIIQEHDQYISVRGGLVLTGEYHARGLDEEEASSTTLPVGARTVQDLITREDGVSVLKHKFPVDITIPKNRIQNLNDVYVTIEAFDYELPQQGNLILEAELSISGIYVDQEIKLPQATFPRDALKEEEGVEEEFVYEEDNEDAVVELDEANEEDLVQPLMRGSFDDDVTEEVEEDNDPFTPFIVEAKRDTKVDYFENPALEAEQEEPYVLTRKAPQFEFKSRVDAPVSNQEIANEEEKDGNRDENTLSLTKIFAKEEEAETTRLKMCIVQKDESIESIANRYGVQSQSLIRVNHLDREHLAEGQILYIPVAIGSRK